MAITWGFYQFKRSEKINKPVEEVWACISDPRNLKLITPDYMGFDITTEDVPTRMYPGMMISYKVAPLLGIKTTWVTEITQVEENKYFVDQQRVGPYKIWHHQHLLRPTKTGTIMTDIVSYKPPLGILGSLANQVVIKQKLREIFDYRTEALITYFEES